MKRAKDGFRVAFALWYRPGVASFSKVFGEDNSDESGDALLESVLGQGALEGQTGLACGPTFVAEAIIDREVVSTVRCGNGVCADRRLRY